MAIAAVKKLRLGELLVQEGLLTEKNVHAALTTQERWESDYGHRRLGEVIVRMGLCGGEDVARVLAGQKNVSYVAIRKTRIDLSLFENFSKNLALKYKALPFERVGPSVSVAMVDPDDLAVLDDIGKRMGCRIRIHLADELALQARIVDAFKAKTNMQTFLAPEKDEDLIVVDPLPGSKPGGAAGGKSGNVAGETPSRLPPARTPDTAAGSAAEEFWKAVESPRPAARPPPPLPSRLSPVPPAVPDRIEGKAQVKAVIACGHLELRNTLQGLTRRLGMRVRVLGGLSNLETRLRTDKPRIVLAGLDCTDLAGIETLKECREAGLLKDVSLVLTGAGLSDWRLQSDLAALTGACGFLATPLDPGEADRKLESLLSAGTPRDPSSGLETARQRAEQLAESGLQLHVQGRYADAAAAFEESLENHDAAKVWFQLGETYMSQGLAYRAMSAFESVVERNPKDFLACRRLAEVAQKLGFKRKAAEAYGRAALVCPNPVLRDKIIKFMVTLY